MRSALGRPLSRYGSLSATTNNTNSLATFHGPTRSARRCTSRLAEVGKFEEKQPAENCYPAGQAFLHRVFGYRGVTVFPWMVRMHDIDLRKHYSDSSGLRVKSDHEVARKTRHESHPQPNLVHDDLQRGSEKAKGKTLGKQANRTKQSLGDSFIRVNPSTSARYVPYYQVLIDTRDRPYVSNRTDTEAVTSLGTIRNSKSVYCIGGLDYVAHEDILPYTSHEEKPIHHELLRKLFKREESVGPQTEADGESARTLAKYTPTDLLYNWRDKHAWLELSRVYRETTENIRVTVIPFYLGNATQTEQNPIRETHFHWWRYCVRLENLGEASVQLRGRNWKIYSPSTKVNFVKGPGVVGVEPVLTKSEPAFQYSSHVNLPDGSGFMWGTFRMQREDGYIFECRIPPFSLHSSLEPELKPMTDPHDSRGGAKSNDVGDDDKKKPTS